MPKDAWIVWNSQRSEGVVFDNEADARLTAKGYDYMRKRMRQGFAIPSIGENFSEYQEEPMIVEKITAI